MNNLQQTYDVCVFYTTSNLSEANNIVEVLSNCHYKVSSVNPFQLATLQTIRLQSDFLLFLIDKNGLGEWNNMINLAGEANLLKDKIIPIILPDGNITHPNVPNYFRDIDNIKFLASSDEPEQLQKLVRKLLVGRLKNSKSNIITINQYNEMLKTTINAYNTPEMQKRFYEIWRNDIPFHKLELFEKRVQRGAKILDAGCGPGHHSKYLNTRGFAVTGIDLSDSFLEIAKKESGTNIFLKMDMRYTSFNASSFDAIWASGSLCHTPEALLGNQINEFARILKPGGILGLTISINRLPSIERDGRFFEGYNDIDRTIKGIEKLGFTILDVSKDITNKTTHGVNKVSQWAAIIVQSKKSS